MQQTVPDILARIAEHKVDELRRSGLAGRRKDLEQAAARRSGRDFAASLRRQEPAIIAEIKKASPSKGLLAGAFDPPAIARQYEAGGAAAVSVLTDERFFQGSLADLESARAAVALPVLRKDFTLDELHVLEAAAHGADAILLIAALLTAGQMRRLREEAESLGMQAVVEIHDGEELQAALDSGARILGVNNRDLRTFQVRLGTSLDLAPRIPPHVIKVSESGIHSAADVRALRNAGFDAFLVGEHLMRAPDPAAALRLLLS